MFQVTIKFESAKFISDQRYWMVGSELPELIIILKKKNGIAKKSKYVNF